MCDFLKDVYVPKEKNLEFSLTPEGYNYYIDLFVIPDQAFSNVDDKKKENIQGIKNDKLLI